MITAGYIANSGDALFITDIQQTVISTDTDSKATGNVETAMSYASSTSNA